MRSLLLYALLCTTASTIISVGIPGRRWYIAGLFETKIGGIKASNIIAYDQTWNSLMGGTNGRVHVVHIDKCNNVYIGGEFTHAGGVYTGPIAVMKNGATNWSPIGHHVILVNGSAVVRALSVDCNEYCQCSVYAGGGFTFTFVKPPLIKPNVAINIVKWDAIYGWWDYLSGDGHNMTNNGKDDVYDIYVSRYFDKRVWIGGSFPGLLSCYDYDTNEWSTLLKHHSNSDIIYTLGGFEKTDPMGHMLYVGGNFSAYSNDVECSTLCLINMDTKIWSRMIDKEIKGYVMTIDSSGPDLYIGGWFHYGTIMNKFVGKIRLGTKLLQPISPIDEDIFNHPVRTLSVCTHDDIGCSEGTAMFGAKNGLLKYFAKSFDTNGTWYSLDEGDDPLQYAQIYSIDSSFFPITPGRPFQLNVLLLLGLLSPSLFVIIVILYCVIGFMYNMKRGKIGWERVPNIGLIRWLDFYICLICCGVVRKNRLLISTRPYESL